IAVDPHRAHTVLIDGHRVFPAVAAAALGEQIGARPFGHFAGARGLLEWPRGFLNGIDAEAAAQRKRQDPPHDPIVSRYDALVKLPVQPPVDPMLAKLSDELPEGEGWLFEPKWDGFRALVFRDGDEVYTQSRESRPLDRYFPELAPVFRAQLPERCVIDGEIVIATGAGLDFETLQMRLHPAKSRVDKLARETPAAFVAFDLLAMGDEDLRGQPQAERRTKLEAALAGAKPPLHLTPMTRDRAVAADWFTRFEGAGLDGVMAK